MDKAIIFGASGQDGIYLTELLTVMGIEVIPISRSFNKVFGDISNTQFVETLIKNETPKYIFHFAANSTTNHSALKENHASISTGTLNILEATKKYSPNTKIFLSGSAMQFKNEGTSINESTPFEAKSAYSAERIYSVYLARYYREKFNISIYIGYLFNHDSPLRTENHINQKIVMSAIRIANGSQDRLIIGDLNVRKEFNYAGDIVSAIWKFVSQNEIFEMVIGSGVAYSIKTWIQYCFKMVGLNWEEYIIFDDKFVSEYSILVSNPSLLKSIGWVPSKDIFQTADIMLDISKKSIK